MGFIIFNKEGERVRFATTLFHARIIANYIKGSYIRTLKEKIKA